MAIQLAYTARFRTVFDRAYHRVAKIDLDYGHSRAMLEVWIYPDAATRDADPGATVQRTVLQVADTPDGAAFTKHFSAEALAKTTPSAAAYAYLKSLGSYKAALDV